LNAQTLIARRRDGLGHTRDEIAWLVRGATDGGLPDYQLAAWLMAAYLNPLSPEETAWLTLEMAASGRRIELDGLPKPWVDKHSTGGVGDKTTIVLLPLLAACGLTMVKMSGRGLGITGGTIDKLESVPGFRLDLSPEEMKAQAERIGLALTGQTPALAPADKTLYALRDATATVDSIPLIVSSILSKKIAGGAETVVLDVKAGSGAFMPTAEAAEKLAGALVATGQLAGLRVEAAITDMSQPLGRAIGNALEVEEARDLLRGKATGATTARLRELCLHLAGLTLWACGNASSTETGRETAERALASGAAAERARLWFEAQGADFEVRLPQAPVRREILAEVDGWIGEIDARAVGESAVRLGAGRASKEDAVDPRVGLEIHAPVGARVRRGEPLATIHAASHSAAEETAALLAKSIAVKDGPVREVPVVLLSPVPA
jgi:pyrimidine-nucleoside phosphorylase